MALQHQPPNSRMLWPIFHPQTGHFLDFWFLRVLFVSGTKGSKFSHRSSVIVFLDPSTIASCRVSPQGCNSRENFHRATSPHLILHRLLCFTNLPPKKKHSWDDFNPNWQWLLVRMLNAKGTRVSSKFSPEKKNRQGIFRRLAVMAKVFVHSTQSRKPAAVSRWILFKNWPQKSLEFDSGWCPPVISWCIIPFNHSQLWGPILLFIVNFLPFHFQTRPWWRGENGLRNDTFTLLKHREGYGVCLSHQKRHNKTYTKVNWDDLMSGNIYNSYL